MAGERAASDRSVPARQAWSWLLMAGFVCCCGFPWLARLAHPSLFADDIERISQVREFGIGRLLITRFNEHVAPLFQVVTWLAWNAAGQRLRAMPLALTLASYLPFVLTLGLLTIVLRRELGSMACALVGTALFCISPVYHEAVHWYSGSSFAWALAVCLGGYWAALGWDRGSPRRSRWLFATAVAAALAPAFSAIGVLAGPFIAIRLFFAASDRTTHRIKMRFLVAAIPLFGTLAYLLFYRWVLGLSLGSPVAGSFDPWYGLWFVVRGPVDVLIPRMVGSDSLAQVLSDAVEWSLFLALLPASIVFAFRQRPGVRGLVFAGLWLIVGGYMLTYGSRATNERTWALSEITRYHIFPQLGFSLILASVARRWLGRFDVRPARGLAVACGVAIVLLIIQYDQFRKAARFYLFPLQRETLAAIEKLDAQRKRLGIPYDRTIAAFEPIRTRWAVYPIGGHALTMLSRTEPNPPIAYESDRDVLLRSLSAEDAALVCSGIDLSPYMKKASAIAGSRTLAVGRLVRAAGVEHTIDPPGGYSSRGYPSFLEFEFDGVPKEAKFLELPLGPTTAPWEVWWTGSDQAWSAARSATISPLDPTDPREVRRAVSLAQIPHWFLEADQLRPKPRRIRIISRTAARFTADSPKLLR